VDHRLHHLGIKTRGDSKHTKYNNLIINFSVFGMFYMLYNIDFCWVYTCFGVQGGIGCQRFSCFRVEGLVKLAWRLIDN
jgi:hypothetical protein